MAHKSTVAIIGANTSTGAVIAKSIAARYRLLLMDAEQAGLILLNAAISNLVPGADVEILTCCKDASWEADIIIVAVEQDSLAGIAEKMKEVSTCKTVIHVVKEAPAADNRLQQLLPHAKVATLSTGQLSAGTTVSQVFVYGHEEAIEFAKGIIAAIQLHYPGNHNVDLEAT